MKTTIKAINRRQRLAGSASAALLPAFAQSKALRTANVQLD